MVSESFVFSRNNLQRYFLFHLNFPSHKIKEGFDKKINNFKIEFKSWGREFPDLCQIVKYGKIYKCDYLRKYYKLCKIFNFFEERSVSRCIWHWLHWPIGRQNWLNWPFFYLKYFFFWEKKFKIKGPGIWPEMADFIKFC